MATTSAVPEVTKEQIVAGLRELGLSAGMGLMVHSSLKSFGRVDGGPRTVIEALMEAVTASGTLLMPSFNHGAPFGEGGTGCYDPLNTRTTNGAIPDCFWRMPDVHRSLNPTHPFAAWGKHAERYTARHHQTLSMGPESPLGLLHADNGSCLLIGVDYQSNTFHHVVEMSTNVPCLGQRTEAYPVRVPDGRTITGRTWGWRASQCPFTDQDRYAARMRAAGLERRVKVGNSALTLFRLRDCYEVIAKMLRKGADGFPPCSGCAIRPRESNSVLESDWDAESQRLRADSEAWTY